VPEIYGSLLDKEIGCDLIKFQTGNEYCKINDNYQILIYLNGSVWLSDVEYRLSLTKMTNPNYDLSNHKWTVTSYFDKNVYDGRMISTKEFDSPPIQVV